MESYKYGDENFQTDPSKGIEQINDDQHQPEHYLADQLGHGYSHQLCGVEFEDRPKEHEDEQGDNTIVKVHQFGAIATEHGHEGAFGQQHQKGHKYSSDKGYRHHVVEVTIVSNSIGGGFSALTMEVGVESEGRGVKPEECKTADQRSGFDDITGQTDFLGGKKFGDNKESGQEADESTCIADEGSFDTLAFDNPHSSSRPKLQGLSKQCGHKHIDHHLRIVLLCNPLEPRVATSI